MEIPSALITLGAVLLGWFLGQGSTVVREWRARRRILRALLEELFDCASYVERNILTSELLVQTVEVHAFLGFAPVHVPQTVFDRYYPDVVVRLRRGERISFSAIHARIHEMNGMSEQIAQRLTQRDTSEEAFKSFGELAAAFRINARVTKDMISFHRRHRRSVDPWLDPQQKERVAGFMAEVAQLRTDAQQMGYDGVREKVLGHE
jgi:hypothetical protein